MADAIPATLLFRGNRPYGVGTITFDLILSEDHSFGNAISSHDIEDGSTISDHIENELVSGSLSGLISNFSLKVEGLTSNRAQDAFDEIRRLWRSREPVTIVTVLSVYEDYAIRDISVARSEATGEAIALNISFREIRRVSLRRVNLEVDITVTDMNDDLSRQAAPQSDLGRQTGVPLSSSEQARATAALEGTS
jgi:hypothetical protein